MRTKLQRNQKPRHRLAGALFLALTATMPVLGSSPAPAATNADEAAVTVRLEHLGSVLRAWEAYKERHIEPSGRVVDGANGAISHSEGQGYAMIIAAKLADRETFDLVWSWTWQNLGVRSDYLFAWQWSPDADPHITDANNATDGDILIAWALMEAAELWNEPHYRDAARLIARDVATYAVSDSPFGKVFMPAEAGFGPNSRSDGPVINLSYWVFPALKALERAEPTVDWDEIFDNGANILRTLRDGGAGDVWPSEWTSLAGPDPVPAEGFDPIFGYNAIRIPLYVAWADPESDVTGVLEPYRALRHADGTGPYVAEAQSGVAIKPLREPGFAAIATLTDCALSVRETGTTVAVVAVDDAPLSDAATPAPESRRTTSETNSSLVVSLPRDGQNYYPETLNLLAALVQLEDYSACFD